MSAAREEVLARVRRALEGAEPPPPVTRRYRETGDLTSTELVSHFVERVEETGATVARAADVSTAVESALAVHGARNAVVAADLAAAYRPRVASLVVDDDLAPHALDLVDAAVTSCASACADTGTIAFDGGPGQGRRALTLVPDLHVCVVEEGQVVQTVPELIARLEPSARAGRPIVLVSGPSATSDIEFERVEGVHGPRRLVVVLTPGPP